MIELEQKIFEEHRAVEPVESVNIEPVVVVPSPPCRSSRVSHPSERYLNILTKNVEKIFLIGDKSHGDDLKIYDEAISDIDSEK